ncbi:unnamed protein product [Sphagnum balticum]
MHPYSLRELSKDTKSASSIWKLLMLLVVGLCGVYVCMIGVDNRPAFQKFPRNTVFQVKQQQEEHVTKCPKLLKSPTFTEHYPHPNTFDRAECTCTPVHTFVILSMQRSGSGWFETLLNSHPNISSHGEVFSAAGRRENFTTITETLESVFNLDWMSSAAKNECTSAIGLKWMLNQGVMEYHSELAAYFKQKGVSVILLLRRNSLKRMISILANAYDKKEKLLNGTHKSHVHSKEEALMLAAFKPMIDVKHLLHNLQRVQEITDDALQFFNGTRLLPLFYEDLLNSPSLMLQVQEFVGVKVQDLQSEQVKIHTQPLQEQIQNWDEVSRHLQGTQFEHFLQDKDYS